MCARGCSSTHLPGRNASGTETIYCSSTCTRPHSALHTHTHTPLHTHTHTRTRTHAHTHTHTHTHAERPEWLPCAPPDLTPTSEGCCHEPRMFVLWGMNNDADPIPDAWVFNVNSLTWNEVCGQDVSMVKSTVLPVTATTPAENNVVLSQRYYHPVVHSWSFYRSLFPHGVVGGGFGTQLPPSTPQWGRLKWLPLEGAWRTSSTIRKCLL